MLLQKVQGKILEQSDGISKIKTSCIKLVNYSFPFLKVLLDYCKGLLKTASIFLRFPSTFLQSALILSYLLFIGKTRNVFEPRDSKSISQTIGRLSRSKEEV